MLRLRSFLMPMCLLVPALAQSVDEGAEPNDFTGTPTVVDCGRRVHGHLGATDLDYYQIFISSPTLLKAYTSVGDLTTTRIDSILEVHDFADVKLSEDDDAGQSVSSYVGCNITTPGVYYIVVRGFLASTSGTYTLDIMCSPLALPEGAEPNNGPLVASPGACGQEHHGFIAAGDDDWWSVAHTGGNLVISTGPGGPDAPPSGLAVVDTVIEVYSAASLLLGTADDEGEAFYSALSLPLAAGLYYVKVYEFDPAAVGYYSLRIGCGESGPLDGQIGNGIGTQPGCVGSAGVPTLSCRSTNLSNTGARVRPRIGTTFSLDLANLPPASLVFHVTGLSTPPAFDLTGFGAPACFVSVSLDLLTVDFASATGRARTSIFVPFNPTFSGFALHWQSASFAAAHNAAGVATSNVMSGVIGNIAFQ